MLLQEASSSTFFLLVVLQNGFQNLRVILGLIHMYKWLQEKSCIIFTSSWDTSFHYILDPYVCFYKKQVACQHVLHTAHLQFTESLGFSHHDWPMFYSKMNPQTKNNLRPTQVAQHHCSAKACRCYCRWRPKELIIKWAEGTKNLPSRTANMGMEIHLFQ